MQPIDIPRFERIDLGEVERHSSTKSEKKPRLSLKQLFDTPKETIDDLEAYIMHDEEGTEPKTLIVNRSTLIINEKESTVMSFSDITAYKRLKKQEEISNLLRAINMTVHHEMLAPLKANIEICGRLIKLLKDHSVQKDMAQILFVSS